MKNNFKIREACHADINRILEIYDYYVKNTAITFEYTTPSITEFKNRMDGIKKSYPYLVISENDKVIGYAYASPFNSRAAYLYSCETSIYLDHNYLHCGAGRILYEALTDKLKDMGILNLYACIAYPNENNKYLTTNSVEFHKRLGYKVVGKFTNCGFKFNTFFSMVWTEKILKNKPEI